MDDVLFIKILRDLCKNWHFGAEEENWRLLLFIYLTNIMMLLALLLWEAELMRKNESDNVTGIAIATTER